MSFLHNTGDWFQIGHANTFRKVEIYSMDWPQGIDLESNLLFAAPYGGPIALVRDWKQILVASGSTKPVIRIFTSSGKLISSFTWNSGTLLTMGWSDSEELLCVQDDGLVLIYDIFGKYQHTFSMGQEAKDTKIIDARIFPSTSGTGLAVMTTNHRVFLVNSIKELKNRLLPEMPKSILNPTSWEIIIEDRNTYCLVAREREIFKLMQGDSVCTLLGISMQADFKKIVLMAVSFSHKHIALYTDTGSLWLGSADLKTKYCEYNTTKSDLPTEIAWCDPDNNRNTSAVVVAYPSQLNSKYLVVGTNGEQSEFFCDPTIHLVTEMDGVRVVTNSYHELIQRVPKCVRNIFCIISEPSSMLFEAQRKFQEKSHQSDEYLCMIMDKLEMAVNECVEAASYEFDAETQKSLFRAAYFGKGFLSSYDVNEYVRISRVLRVLNNIRHPSVGIPLTYTQFNHLKPNVLLDRLVFRKHYGLAIQIAKHLKLPETRILEHWAFHKIIHDKDDDDIAKKIAAKFRNPASQNVSFCTVAKKAQEIGKKRLAILLLDLEPKQSLQVPILLNLGEHKKALMAATQSGDTDLIYMVLLQLKEITPLADFQMTIRAFPLAQNLYKKYCQLHSPATLKDIYTQEDDYVSHARMALRDSNDAGELNMSLPLASTFYKKAQKPVETELCDEMRKLLKLQQILDKKYTIDFSGLSLHATIKHLLNLGDVKLADKMRSEYKVPERRYWWLRIQVLADQFRWDELEKFSKTKKSPIGYEPFVEVCLAQQNVDEAQKYLSKCDGERKVKLLLRAGLYEEAAQIAFEQKDLNVLFTMMNSIPPNCYAAIGKVEAFIAQLSTKK